MKQKKIHDPANSAFGDNADGIGGEAGRGGSIVHIGVRAGGSGTSLSQHSTTEKQRP
jgi:hypothetical protein